MATCEIAYCRHPEDSQIYDHTTGDVICRNCALVLVGDLDKCSYSFLASCEVSTIDKNKVTQEEKVGLEEFIIRLNLPRIILERSYSYYEAHRNTVSKNQKHELQLYCVYMAAAVEGVHYTLKELAELTGANVEDLCKVEKVLSNTSDIINDKRPSDFVHRYCGHLDIPYKHGIVISAEADMVFELVDRSPQAVAAAVLWRHVLDDSSLSGISLQEVVAVAKVSRATIGRVLSAVRMLLPEINSARIDITANSTTDRQQEKLTPAR